MKKNKIIKHFRNIKNGYLIINTPEGEVIELGDKNSILCSEIYIKDWLLIDLMISKGDIGLGESYIKQYFTTNKIENLLLFFALNQKYLDSVFYSNIFYSLFFWVKNLFKKNNLRGSRKNIKEHYDLGNDFYQLWLDETMSYSSAIFAKNNELSAGQRNKYDRILQQIGDKAANILEIGCGWGGFINEASKKGHYVKGLTLSKNQKQYCDKLIADNKLNGEVMLQDYRLENGQYDNIISIEMFEAVGKKYWDIYFSKIKKCLKPNGKVIIQTIVIDQEFYKKYAKTSDFIREYIFPGGFLPSSEIFKKKASENGLKIIDEFKFSKSYQETLLKWLENFNQKQKEVINLGYSEEFIRKWQFYLAYCAAAFAIKRTNVVQYSLVHIPKSF